MPLPIATVTGGGGDEALTAVIDGLHSGPRDTAEFHSVLDKTSAPLRGGAPPPQCPAVP